MTQQTALQKALCTFGQESFAPVRMSKQKKARMIPVQVTARSRRKYTMRGSRVAQRIENGLTRQLVVGEEEDVVYYKLPGAKKKQKKNKHDIIDAVDNVRGAEKNTREKKSCYLFFHS